MKRAQLPTALASIAMGAALITPTASAATISCETLATNSEPNLSGYWADGTQDAMKTGAGYACQGIDPASVPSPPNQDLSNDSEDVVNLHGFFGYTDWTQLERDNTPGIDPGVWLNIEPERGANEGTWAILSPNFWSVYGTAMLVFKDGNLPGKYPDGCVNTGRNQTCLRTPTWVGYLVSPGHLSGDWGWFDPANLSHATLYVREGDDHQVPEPGTLALLWLGLMGLAATRQRLRATR